MINHAEPYAQRNNYPHNQPLQYTKRFFIFTYKQFQQPATVQGSDRNQVVYRQQETEYSQFRKIVAE